MISLVVDFSKKEKKEKLWKILKTLKEVKYSFEIKQYRANRSNPQNRYFHGPVLDILSQHTGFTPAEMKEYLKDRFLPVYKVLPNGEEVRVSRHTSELNTIEFEEFLDNVKRFAIQELDCYIPDPNEEL